MLSKFLRFAVFIAALVAGHALAARPSDLVSAASEGRARAEGRARLVQTCAARGAALPVSLLADYEEARGTFNARIDGIVLHVRTSTVKDLDANAELSRLNDALNKVDRFARRADDYLGHRRCSAYRKAVWSQIAAIVLTPEVMSAVWQFFQNTTASMAEREEFLKSFEAQRIAEWSKVRALVVYDWATREFLAGDQLNLPALTKGSTSLYVNEWGLERSDPTLSAAKEPPPGLSPSFKLYTGDPGKVLPAAFPLFQPRNSQMGAP